MWHYTSHQLDYYKIASISGNSSNQPTGFNWPMRMHLPIALHMNKWWMLYIIQRFQWNAMLIPSFQLKWCINMKHFARFFQRIRTLYILLNKWFSHLESKWDEVTKRKKEREKEIWNGNSFVQLKCMKYLISEEDIIFCIEDWNVPNGRRIIVERTSGYNHNLNRQVNICLSITW